jgi:hypothetical protein
MLLTMLSTIAPKKAEPNPAMKNPGTRAAANCSIKALITSQKSPSVRRLRGKVNSLSKRPSVALIKPMAMGAINAVPNPRSSIPGKRNATIIKLAALMNQWISRSNTMSNHYQSNGTQTMQPTRLAKSRSRCKMSPFNH